MKYFTSPPGASPDKVESHLVDVLHGNRFICETKIIHNFTKDSCLQVVICTDAFSMGVNCTDVRLVIHYSVPSDEEMCAANWKEWKRWEGTIHSHTKKKMEN